MNEQRKLVVASLRALAVFIEGAPEIVGFDLKWRGTELVQTLVVNPGVPIDFIKFEVSS